MGEISNQDLLLGIVGRFWRLKGDLQLIDVEGFNSFNKEGYAKAAWNFHLRPHTETITQVVTETRIRCLDERSLRRFRLYWIFVRPFSAWIRREALRIIKKEAEGKRSLPATAGLAQPTKTSDPVIHISALQLRKNLTGRNER